MENLNKAEEAVLSAAVEGRECYFGSPELKNKWQREQYIENPFKKKDYDDDNTIRSDFLYKLCSGLDTGQNIHRKGIWIFFARIIGNFDWESAELVYPLGLIGCRIESEIILRDAKVHRLNFLGSYMPNFLGDRLRAQTGLKFDYIIIPNGQIDLRGAHINGDLEFNGAKVCAPLSVLKPDTNPEKRKFISGVLPFNFAVSLDNIHVDGSIRFGPDAQIVDGIRIAGATIQNSLELYDCDFIARTHKNLFIFERSRVGNLFVWRNVNQPNGGCASFAHSTVGPILDDEDSWPEEINLNGFIYESFGEISPKEVDKRLHWINLQPESYFSPQSYDQLIHAYRNMGLTLEGKKVSIQKQRDLRSSGQLNSLSKLWNIILDFTIGYGYGPWRVFVFIIITILLGEGIFYLGNYLGIIVPSSSNEKSIFPYFWYSLDTFLPIIDLSIEKKWQILLSKSNGWFFQSYYLAHVLLGYFLTTLAVVSASGLIKKD